MYLKLAWILANEGHSLIAIMLGRLEMDIDECIDKYIELSSKVFRRDRLLPIHLGLRGKSGTVAARFDSQALEESVKTILQEKGLDRDALLKSSGPGELCKVCVQCRPRVVQQS